MHHHRYVYSVFETRKLKVATVHIVSANTHIIVVLLNHSVMGAVVSRKEEPLLVMEYMDHGSLYDILHNETIVLEGDLILPILRDIARGLRFLHAAKPQVIHGDLKAMNVLVDSRFRAKVRNRTVCTHL